MAGASTSTRASLADITGDGRADIVGFGDDGVWVALGNGDGTFQSPRLVIGDFGFEAGGWRVDKHPRFVADITGDGRADIIGFGNDGVYVALSNGDGTFNFTPIPAINDFGFEAGGWRVDKHPRFVADITGDGRADIIGFGNDGVYVALSNGDGTFNFTPIPAINDFGFEAGGWRVDRHPRLLAGLRSKARADIVGFGDAGVLVALSNGDGTFTQRPLFVVPNFGFRDSGPVDQVGPFLPSVNANVVQASGGHTATVFYVCDTAAAMLWKWTEGMASWQQLVPGGGAAQARRVFVKPVRAEHGLRAGQGARDALRRRRHQLGCRYEPRAATDLRRPNPGRTHGGRRWPGRSSRCRADRHAVRSLRPEPPLRRGACGCVLDARRR